MNQPGLYPGVRMGDYLALKHFSGSLAHRLLCQSPGHAKWALEHPDDDANDASDAGIAIHDGVLEGIDRIVVIDAPDWRTKAAKEAREIARSEGKIPMLFHKYPRIEAAIKAVHAFVAQSEIAGCFDSGQPEVVGIWDEENIRCKLRCDWLSDQWHISLKTTPSSANPVTWIRRQMGPMDYDTSLCLYERGLRTLEKEVEHRILLCEQDPPFACSLIALAPSREEYACRRVERAITTWQRCVKANAYPFYDTRTYWAEAMPYEVAQEEEADMLSEDELKGGVPA